MGLNTPIPTSAPGWTDDTDQLSGRVSASGKREVNTLGECGRIGVVAGAEDDSGMLRGLSQITDIGKIRGQVLKQLWQGAVGGHD